MSFTLTTNRSKYICDIFDTCSIILKMGDIIVKEDGLYVSGMDSMHVSLISLEINKSDFTGYVFEPDMETKSISIGVNFEEFVKLLKASSGHDDLILQYDGTPKLDIIFSNDGLRRKYSLKLIDIEVDELHIPSTDYFLELSISSQIFNSMINSVAITGADEMRFSIKNNRLITSSTGDLSDTEFIFNKESGYESRIGCKINLKKRVANISPSSKQIYKLISCQGDFSSSIGLNLLKNISKANSLTPTIMCNMSPDKPLRLDYEFNDNGSVLYYYISPKIE